MSTHSIILVTGPIQDGYVLPAGMAAFAKLTIGSTITRQIVCSIDGTSVHGLTLVNDSLLDLTPSTTLTIEAASNVAVRLINPVAPKYLDVLVLVNGLNAGIYQYVAGVWVYRGNSQLVPLVNSVVKNTSVGLRSNLSFVGGVCAVTVVDTVPQVMLPYTIYVDRANGLVYFPYFTANAYQYPTAVASIWSPDIVALLYEEQLVVISPCGYKQSQSLPISPEYIHLSYTSLLNASIHQPIAYHNQLLEVIHNTVITPTSHQIDYSVIQGLSDTEYQLTNGYYKGGNNLWDVVVSSQGTVSTNHLLEIVPVSTYTSALVDLQFSQFAPATARVLNVYIGKPADLSAANIAYRLVLAMGTTNRIQNIRLAAGESIHVKLNSAVTVNYRYTVLARTF